MRLRDIRRQNRERDSWPARQAQQRADEAASLLCSMRAEPVRGLTREECGAPTRRVCFLCGGPLPIRRQWWCSTECALAWAGQHEWGSARNAAGARDGWRCVRCGERGIEVNHIEPRRGRGYHAGCHNHLANLESLCGPCHQAETNRQRAEATP